MNTSLSDLKDGIINKDSVQSCDNVNNNALKTPSTELLHRIHGSGLQAEETLQLKDRMHYKSENQFVVPRKMAWTHIIDSVSNLQASIFEFISPFSPSNTIIKPSVQSEAISIAPLKIQKHVKFTPAIGQDQRIFIHDQVHRNDSSSSRLQVMALVEQSRHLERSYVVPDDLPSFGWWDCFQLGRSLTYTALCLRRNISPRCLVFQEQCKQNGETQQSITATQLAKLAYTGLAFNTSTQSVMVRGKPPSPKKTLQEKPKGQKQFECPRLRSPRIATRLKHRKKFDSKKKRVAKVSKRKLEIVTRPVKHVAELKAKLGAKSKTLCNEAKGKEPIKDKTKIGSFGAIAVFRALRVNRTLLSLHLEYVAIDDTALCALAAALRVNWTLTHISLAGNQIGPIGARDLADALEDSPDSMLLDLDLRDNCLGAQGARELGRALRENETLTRCDLSSNQIHSLAVLDLLTALQDNFVFRELCVFGHDLLEHDNPYLYNLDYSSAQDFVAALRQLNDSFAIIRVSSARALLPIDKIQSSRWLHLANRDLMELDGLIVAGLLPQNSVLLSLEMHDNPHLGGATVLEVLSAIKDCVTLRHVNLSNTGLFPHDGEKVGELVGSNCTLLTIKMHETIISVQQARGNQKVGDVPDTMTCTVDPTHFLDRWVFSKCFAVNRLTQEVNELRIPEAPRSTTVYSAIVNVKHQDDLVSLKICGRPLELYEAAFLGSKIFHHRHLGRVTLNNCKLDGAAVRALADGTRNHSTLHTLELENNALGPIGGQAMAECLASSNALTYLNLSWTQLGDDGVLHFEEALMQNTSLQRLDLRGNDVRVRGVRALANGVRHTATLRELHLRWNTITPAGAEALALAVEINQSLQLLDIEHHTMGSRGAAAFASMLARNKYLQHLNISGTGTTDSDDARDAGPGIGSDQAQRIVEALQKSNTSLRILHISANCLDADATAQFGELLLWNKTLVTLNLSHSGLNASKASRFFACLSANCTLERLDLAHNCIGNEGLMACTRALETNRTLRELNLAYNGMTEEPLALLAAKLHSPKRSITLTLKWLALTGNTMTERTRQQYTLLPQNVIAVELQDEDYYCK